MFNLSVISSKRVHFPLRHITENRGERRGEPRKPEKFKRGERIDKIRDL